MARSPQQQAADFVAANDRSPVVEGSVFMRGGMTGPQGVYYRLADRSEHRLGKTAAALLPAGYPRWRLD